MRKLLFDMGVKGRRNRSFVDEPSVLRNVEDIIELAKKNGHIEGYQVDIEKIINNHKDLVLRKDDKLKSTVSGYLKFKEGKWELGVNSNHHVKRQRFTMAHEFAHFVLHRDERGTFEDEEIYFRKGNDSSIEFKADEFAAALLMPESLFKKAIIEDGIKKITELAELFNVSTLAIKHRAQSLNFKTSPNEK